MAESAISSGSAGSSSDGAENTAAIVAGLALISVAAASSILLQVGKNAPPQIQPTEYTGPSLTYYINKFKPPEITEVSVRSEAEPSAAVQPDSATATDLSQVQVEAQIQPETSDVNIQS